MPTQVTLGSISRATLRPHDLIPAFADALEEFDPAEFARLRRTWRDLFNNPASWEELCESQGEDCHFLIDDLQDSLNQIAPDLAYFGAHPGDGSDFGFWPCWDAIQDAEHEGELIKIDAGSEWPELADDVCWILEVNDHGNTTLFSRDHVEIWSAV